MTAKDLILYVIGRISTQGGTGYCIEYTGEAIRSLSMEERMTVCNMSIEAGARAGMIAPDETTYQYLRNRQFAPDDFNAAVERWKRLPSDEGAAYDRSETFNAADIEPQVTWGTNPGQVVGIGAQVPDPSQLGDPTDQKAAAGALEYMDLQAGTPMESVSIDRVFIGSMYQRSDRGPAGRGHGGCADTGWPDRIDAMVVPGSGLVKRQAEAEGLDKIFTEAGLEWREAGCSMCPGHEPRQA